MPNQMLDYAPTSTKQKGQSGYGWMSLAIFFVNVVVCLGAGSRVIEFDGKLSAFRQILLFSMVLIVAVLGIALAIAGLRAAGRYREVAMAALLGNIAIAALMLVILFLAR